MCLESRDVNVPTLPINSFEQLSDGSWRPSVQITIELEGAGKISVGPWLVIRRGTTLMGYDATADLEAQAAVVKEARQAA
jgi:hypothetical protein